MASAADKLEAMIQTFDAAHPGTAAGMHGLLEASPEFRTRVLKAIEAGELERFEPLSDASRKQQRIGAYRPGDRAIELSEGLLALAASDGKAANRMLLTLGHEVEHAIDRKAMREDFQRFVDAAQKIADGPSPHDYTGLIRERVDTLRGYEARHELAAVDLLAAKVGREHPGADRTTQCDALRNATGLMARYFEPIAGSTPTHYAPRPGLTFDDHFRIAPGEAQVAAFGRYFYDANDYPRSYGAEALQRIGLIEEFTQSTAAGKPGAVAPEVRVDLSALGMRGMALPPGFTDTSLPPGRRIHGSGWDDPVPGHLPPRESAPDAVRSPLHRQARDALDALGIAAGLPSGDAKDAVAAAIALRAQDAGWRSIDAILPSRDGQGLIAVQGDPSTPQAKTCYVDRDDALRQPLAQTLARLQGDGDVPAPTPVQAPTGPVR